MTFSTVIQTHYKDIPLHVARLLFFFSETDFPLANRTEQKKTKKKKQEDHSNLRLHAGTSDSLTA